ncbi:hypothetical protein A3B46_01150 [Candidatus Roizmanbacteria bacterium RIFCSPLOWO2_01_FULL_39_19]|nr:MAG: hypothetical protein A3B46_01150 [Candidatus Roizmanbacteria bacterium RIFCSPLOWO2_01_FULL_39_19]
MKTASSKISENELAKINAQMYEQNLDLATKNKTLFTLSKIYEIVNTSLGVGETSEKIIEAIVKELNFQGAAIALVDKSSRRLSTVAAFHENGKNHEIAKILKIIGQLSLPLSTRGNIAIESLHQKKTKLTNNLHDLIVPLISKDEAARMQVILKAQTFAVYPILVGSHTLGVLVIGLEKSVADLSQSERETLHELIDVVGLAIERSQIYASLQRANKKLKELDQLKDDFVSVASHELRTPMTAIKSYLWMALNGKGGPISKKEEFYLDRAYNSTDRLIKLVNDMLNISRIESGRMTYDMVETDIVRLCSDVFEEVTPRSRELGVFVKFDKDYGSSFQFTTLHNSQLDKIKTKLAYHSGVDKIRNIVPPVLADPDKIKEVLFNLIGNSLKFTDTGGSISVSFAVKGGFVETSVVDTGVGMEKEDLEKLFRKFGLMQGSYQTTKKASVGTGLGLYISKLIVETHRGEITANSAGKDRGSTFTFTLPVYSKKVKTDSKKLSSSRKRIDVIHSGL